jgi:pyrimidine operon attenuation protein/uracil phosphoribosyltransferase
MASEIIDATEDGDRIALVGIRSGGVPLAHRLGALIHEAESDRPEVGAIDITLYRDDLYTGLEKPTLGVTELPFDLEGTGIVLVDDVLFTGRTVRAALDAVHDYGRPRWIRLAVLVDRGHRQLPIQADVVGRRVETALADKVVVEVSPEPSKTDSVRVEPARGGA